MNKTMLNKPIIYQMLPRLWGNMNENCTPNGNILENGTGKFSDIDKNTLKYIKWMGCTHVWFTGVIRHSTSKLPDTNGELLEDSKAQIVKGEAGSPYAIKDYFDVNPYLADKPSRRMLEFKSLLTRTHKAGLKAIIDFVPNHVARDYGKTANKKMASYVLGNNDNNNVHWCAENDFFYYPGQALKLPNDKDFYPIDRYTEYPAKATGNVFTPEPSINDWYETIKINYCDFHTETWDKMAEVIRFWAAKGVDGFRCDMVELVPPQFFAWLIPTIKAEFPDVIFIAEVYDKNQYHKYINEVGFDYLYDKSGLYDTIRSIVEGQGSTTGITQNWQFLGDLQPHMLNFLENHDEQRFASDFFGKDASHSYAALYASLFMNTAPFMLYFGEEMGERGMDHEGFSGQDGRTTIFDWWSVKSLRILKSLIDNQPLEQLRLENPSERANDVFFRYISALQLASTSKAIKEGTTYDLCWCNQESAGFNKDKHFVFLRHADNETLLIFCNFSDETANVDIKIPSHAISALNLDSADLQGCTPYADGNCYIHLNVAPYDGLVLTL